MANKIMKNYDVHSTEYHALCEEYDAYEYKRADEVTPDERIRIEKEAEEAREWLKYNMHITLPSAKEII